MLKIGKEPRAKTTIKRFSKDLQSKKKKNYTKCSMSTDINIEVISENIPQ